MEGLVFTLFFILGIILGSFFNVVGLRMPQNISFVHGHSSCPSCKKQLQWYELIPILSYVFQRGQCTHCHYSLSRIYPFTECVTGCLFAFSYLQIGLTSTLFPTLIFISFLMIVVVTDITYMVIPNKLLLFFLPIFITIRILYPLDPFYDAVLGAIIGFLLIALIIIISGGGMGAGDMKLFAVIGFVLGVQHFLLCFFLAFFLVGVFVGF